MRRSIQLRGEKDLERQLSLAVKAGFTEIAMSFASDDMLFRDDFEASTDRMRALLDRYGYSLADLSGRTTEELAGQVGREGIAAVAGALAGETDPAVPLGGAELLGLNGLTERYSENDLDRLILGGVTPVESLNGTVSVVRGVTTRTTTGGAADNTWHDLSTIRVVDDVIPALRTRVHGIIDARQ